MPTAPAVDDLVGRAVAFGLLARLLGDDPAPLASGTGVVELQRALEALGETEAAEALARLDGLGPFDEASIRDQRVRLFDTGKVAPYELSHVPPGAASHMGMLADVAAFYRAYNMQVGGERPDHCVAELEFASLVTLAEADCHQRGDEEGIEVNASAARRFLGDHLGGWLQILAAKLEQTDPSGPYGPIALTAARFVESEAARRRVIPVRRAGIVPDWDDADDWYDSDGWDGEVPSCGAR